MRTQCCGVMISGQCTDCPITAPIRPQNMNKEIESLRQQLAAAQQENEELRKDARDLENILAAKDDFYLHSFIGAARTRKQAMRQEEGEV